MAVLFLDQRGSRSGELKVGKWADELNERYGSRLELLFVQTAGDELQAVTNDPDVIVSILVDGMRRREWWAAVGLGGVERPLGDSAATSRGDAFYHAREALIVAKRSPYGVGVRGPDPDQARAAEACLNLLGFVLRRRSVNGGGSKRWEAVDLAAEGLSVTGVAGKLGITHQAVSERLRTAGLQEEREGRWLAARLLAAGM
jgi:hypothetical protein